MPGSLPRTHQGTSVKAAAAGNPSSSMRDSEAFMQEATRGLSTNSLHDAARFKSWICRLVPTHDLSSFYSSIMSFTIPYTRTLWKLGLLEFDDLFLPWKMLVWEYTLFQNSASLSVTLTSYVGNYVGNYVGTRVGKYPLMWYHMGSRVEPRWPQEMLMQNQGKKVDRCK